MTTGGTATGGLTSESEARSRSADSRRFAQVEPGFLFAALPGSKADGRGFIAEACRQGRRRRAGRPPAPNRAPGIALWSPMRTLAAALALMAARFFARQPRIVAAVTGTSGKTSTADFTRQIWAGARHSGPRAWARWACVARATATAP